MTPPPIHPNTITAARLPLAPLAVLFLLHGGTWGVVVAAALSLLLELTDLADGWIARKYNVVSDFGKLFDPFSDAFCRFTLFMGLYAMGSAELWMVLLIYYRDSSISFLRSIAATRNIVLAARQSGKIKAIVQGVGTQICFIAIVIGKTVPTATAIMVQVPWWTMLAMTIVTTWSFVDYMGGNRQLLAEAWRDDRAR
jgi:CDP-diacylglycerol--glycerol-3-phosphate 3-phosphatidyltransferase